MEILLFYDFSPFFFTISFLIFTYGPLLFCYVLCPDNILLPFGGNADNDYYPCSNFAGRSKRSGFRPS